MTTLQTGFSFTLDATREARRPPEERGTGRDDVRLLATDRRTGISTSRHFTELPQLLRPGDLLVVNDSATLPAAVWLRRLVLHFSTNRGDGTWLVELRKRTGNGHEPYSGGQPGELLSLPGGMTLKLEGRDTGRLWVARLDASVSIYLSKYGSPIRYSYVDRDWPLSRYQTVFARHSGSAEMPSAGRPFTAPLVNQIVHSGISIVPVTLHTGVASPEADEVPYPEHFTVTEDTAASVNATRAAGGRIIAVGTTVVRALETVARDSGQVRAGSGFTEHVVTPTLGVRAVDGILTGLHEPRSTHLAMLSSIVDNRVLAEAYHQAIAARFLWHEFGDVHLIA